MMERNSSDHINATEEHSAEGVVPGEQEGPVWKRWMKRFGVAGFLFFLIKGLLWLAVPFLAVYFGCE